MTKNACWIVMLQKVMDNHFTRKIQVNAMSYGVLPLWRGALMDLRMCEIQDGTKRKRRASRLTFLTKLSSAPIMEVIHQIKIMVDVFNMIPHLLL